MPAGKQKHSAGVNEDQKEKKRDEEQRVAETLCPNHREGLGPAAPVVQRDQDDGDGNRENDMRTKGNPGWNCAHALSRIESGGECRPPVTPLAGCGP